MSDMQRQQDPAQGPAGVVGGTPPAPAPSYPAQGHAVPGQASPGYGYGTGGYGTGGYGVPGQGAGSAPGYGAPMGAGYPAPGYGAPGGVPVASGLAMKRRNPIGVWLGLPLITFGIYSLVWYYKIHCELREFDRRRQINPAGSLLTIMFGWILIVPPLVSFYNTGERIRNAQRAAGMQPTCSPAVGLLLTFVFGLGHLYYQSELNGIVGRYQGAAPGTAVPLFA